jgi:hypothetical protein
MLPSQVMEVQIEDEMSGLRFYFDIFQNWVCRFVSSTCLRRFTPMKITKESLLLAGGCTPGILKSNKNVSIENWPGTLNLPHHLKPSLSLVLGFVLQWLNNKHFSTE